MVLGLGSKKRGTTVKVEFQIYIQEIKPWKSGSGVNTPLLLQWQRGDSRSGKTKSVVPMQEDGGKVVFNESFRLPAKLIREPEAKGRNSGIPKFQKKTIAFILQEATSELQLARCVVDLAEYGDLDARVPASLPLAVAKKFVSGGKTPTLFLAIGPYSKDRSFASRVSFGSSTPRSSISKAPEKPVSTGKSQVEPALDEDTKKSIMAALMSDEDDDDLSIESFTDDEETPGGSTPRTPKLSTPVLETPNARSSTTSPRSDIFKPSTSRPDARNSENQSSPGSHQSGSQTSSAGFTLLHDPSTGGSTTPSPGMALQSPRRSVGERAPGCPLVPTKHGSGTPTQGSTVIEDPGPSRSSVTQLFSTDPVYKATNHTTESERTIRNEPTKSPGSSSESGNQDTRVIKPPSPSNEREATSRGALVSTESSSSSSRISNSLALSSSETLHSVPELTEREGSLLAERKTETAHEKGATEREMFSKDDLLTEKGRSQEITSPLHSASTKAAAAAAATAYVAKRTFRSSRGSSLDYSYGSSEDSFSEASYDGRSPRQTSWRDDLQAPERSLSSSERSVHADHEDRKNECESAVQREKKQDGSISGSISPDLQNNVGRVPEGDHNNFGGVLENEKEPLIKEQFLQEGDEDQAKVSVLESARANLAKVEKKALDELRNKVANAEAKFLAETKKVAKLEGELRDAAAMEVALYAVVAEHGNSSHKLHTPARRLARLYMHACKHWSPEKRASTAKNCVSGLVTVAKACGTDVSRLSFWWSNIVALRAVITQAFDTSSSAASKAGNGQAYSQSRINGIGLTGWARARRSVNVRSSFTRQTMPVSPKPPSTEWREYSTFISALEKIEEWIYSKIVESLWWQAMIPRMQKDVDASAPTSPRGIALLPPSAFFGSEFAIKAKEDLSKLAGDVTGIFVKKAERSPVSLPELGDARQGNMSVEVWKKAITETLRRLCPVRGAGHDCGCLPMLIRMAVEGCVARLDVALFNAILREPGDDVPTDPLSDPVSDSSVLPISPGGLTFGGGSQLKNVVVTWSTFISGLVSLKEPVFVPDVVNGDNTENSEDSEKVPKFFNLIKATGDLLMLPKDILMDRAIRKEEARREAEKSASLFIMLRGTGDILQLPKDILMDKSVRKEICPMLSLQLIRRILSNFVPDEFAPDPISPSLLAALNAEASIEKQRQGEADDLLSSVPMAAAPSLTYVAPAAPYVWSWIGETSSDLKGWGQSNNSLLRKGYTSDEDLEVMEELQKTSASDKLEFLMGASRQGSVMLKQNGNSPEDSVVQSQAVAGEISTASRFQLLKEVWDT